MPDPFYQRSQVFPEMPTTPFLLHLLDQNEVTWWTPFPAGSWWGWANEEQEQRLEGYSWERSEHSFPVSPLVPIPHSSSGRATSSHNCSSSWAPSSMALALSGLWWQHSISCLFRPRGGNSPSLWLVSGCLIDTFNPAYSSVNGLFGEIFLVDHLSKILFHARTPTDTHRPLTAKEARKLGTGESQWYR